MDWVPQSAPEPSDVVQISQKLIMRRTLKSNSFGHLLRDNIRSIAELAAYFGVPTSDLQWIPEPHLEVLPLNLFKSAFVMFLVTSLRVFHVPLQGRCNKKPWEVAFRDAHASEEMCVCTQRGDCTALNGSHRLHNQPFVTAGGNATSLNHGMYADANTAHAYVTT
jgi:hypothetical protein